MLTLDGFFILPALESIVKEFVTGQY
jgi:hypothetical protein